MFAAKPVLIVEDNAFVALDLSDAIEHLDGKVVGPTPLVSEALALLATHEVAAAIVDGHLPGQDILPLTRLLADRGVPFLLHTTCDIPASIAALHPSVPVLVKPQRPHLVLARLLAAIEESKR
ncbi:MAG: hypothetical protein ABIT69_00335 [Sphingomicrobium sp.]